MSDFKANAQNSIFAVWELIALPRPQLAISNGPTSKGKPWEEGRGKREGEEKGREREEERGSEGKGREGRGGAPKYFLPRTAPGVANKVQFGRCQAMFRLFDGAGGVNWA